MHGGLIGLFKQNTALKTKWYRYGAAVQCAAALLYQGGRFMISRRPFRDRLFDSFNGSFNRWFCIGLLCLCIKKEADQAKPRSAQNRVVG
jgi:hypothetical protein